MHRASRNRVLTMVSTNIMSGTTVTMPIYMNALGTENTFLASVGYDPTKLVLNHVQLGKRHRRGFLGEVGFPDENNGSVGFAILLERWRHRAGGNAGSGRGGLPERPDHEHHNGKSDLR